MDRPEPVVEVVEVPEPEVRARPARESEVPKGAQNIANRAVAEGFLVSVSYARGPRMDARWKVVEISYSIVVRGRHPDGRKFVACWLAKTAQSGADEGKVKLGFDFGYCHGVTGRCNATQVNAYLVAPH